MKVVIFGDSYANNERAYGEGEDKIHGVGAML